MSTVYHRFSDNREAQAFICGLNVAADLNSSDVMGPPYEPQDVRQGTDEDGEYADAIVILDDDEDEPDEEDIVDHREHV